MSNPAFPDDPEFWRIFSRHIVEANGVRINVVSGGVGEPLLLLHGNLDTWTIWSRVMPLLAERCHVIAPDLRGFGDSERVKAGYDKKTLSEDMGAVLDGMGVGRVHVAGHDFGGQIAYHLAAARPDQVATLSVIETLLPGIPITPHGDEGRWWFAGFHMAADVPEMLTRGHEREYATWMLRDFTHPDNEMTPAFEEEVLRTYAEPAALKASFELYRTAGQDAADFASLYGSKLAAPVLALGGEQCFGDRVMETFRQVASDVSGGVVERASHFVPMERPDEVARVLAEFIGRTKIDG